MIDDAALMTEQAWLACDDSSPMLDFLMAEPVAPADARTEGLDCPNKPNPPILRAKTMERKLRLFACACMRRSAVLGGPDRIHAIVTSERYADGLVDRSALEAAFAPTRVLPEPIPWDADYALSVFGPTDMVAEARLIEIFSTLGPDLNVRAVAATTTQLITEREGAVYLSERGKNERSQQAHLLRDIFGNPFRPVSLDPSCLNERTRSVARTIYEKGQFANLPRLARALKKDSGCPSRELWDHCQWPTRHVRGCWVVDLVLGNS